MAIKLKLVTFNFFLFSDKMQRTTKESDLLQKRIGMTVHLRELCTFIDIKIPPPLYLSIFLTQRARSMHDVA